MKQQTNKLGVAAIVVVLAVGFTITGISIWHHIHHAPTSIEKQTACVLDAGKRYDANRQTIATNANGYSPAEQQAYYNSTNAGYMQDVTLCRQMYPN